MTQEEKQKEKAQLINDVIFYSKRLEDLWQYHPENPKRLDVVEEYNYLKNEIKFLEKEIEFLGE
jgi:hypothetical protein